MRIAEINDAFGESTGNLALSIARYGLVYGDEILNYYACLKEKARKVPGLYAINSKLEWEVHLRLGKLTGLNGFFSVIGTWKMLRHFRKVRVDLIHLHNIHAFCINLPMLVRFIRKHRIPVVWTLHGTWPYTGKCVHYTLDGCERWKTGCSHCPQRMKWPESILFDNTSFQWAQKKKWFTSLPQMTIIPSSRWIAGEVQQSFLKVHPMQVIYDGINLNLFRPTPSDFRERYHCGDKTVLLWVSASMHRRKGADVMIELANRLDRAWFQIVMVGLGEKEREKLPECITAIPPVSDKRKLAEIYTAADIFINPTREETFGLVNIEALACGTPVITFRTGGSPECVDESCGRVVACDDLDGLVEAIKEQAQTHAMTSEACIRRASGFSEEAMSMQYLELFHQMIAKNQAGE